jgi:CBS domain containing-hemolysin-like protein
MELFLFFFSIIFIILLSALVSSSEVALISCSQAKIKAILKETKNNKLKSRARNLLVIKTNLQKYISVVVILNNIINIIGSIYVGYLANDLFGEVYLGIVSAVLTFLIIIFAEIIPKIYGEIFSEKLALIVSKPLIWFYLILKPVIFFCDLIVSIFVKENNKNIVSEGEIRELAEIGKNEGSISEHESEMIDNIFKLDDVSVYDIMIPKNKVELIDFEFSYEEIVKIIEKTGFTRFPIKRDEKIVGIINVKDLFKFHNKKKSFSIDKIMRKVVYAPENMNLLYLEEMLKKKRTHMAIVINEHGDFTGIVTLEDVIEEVVGDIEDEFDKKSENFIVKYSNNVYHVDTKVGLDDLNDELGIEIYDEDNSTLNGFLISQIGNIPKINYKFSVDNLFFRVLRCNSKRISMVELKIEDKKN